jgi:hypothetical protein
MTKNGLKYPCYCWRCLGASKDYRTVDNHTEWDIADRPLYRGPIEADVQPDNNPPEPNPRIHNEIKSDDAVVQPYPAGDLEVEDIVSHVEALPNCNQPIYQSVRHNVTILLHYTYYRALFGCYS